MARSPGTKLVADLTPGSSGTDLHELTVVGNYLYFAGPRFIYRTAGSASSIEIFYEFEPAPDSFTADWTFYNQPRVNEMFSSGNRLYFAGNTAGESGGLYYIDLAGSSRTVHRVPKFSFRNRVPPGVISIIPATYPGQFTTVRERVFFADGMSIWVTDGTESGTKVIHSGHDLFGSAPNHVLYQFNDSLLFSERSQGPRFWRVGPDDTVVLIAKQYMSEAAGSRDRFRFVATSHNVPAPLYTSDGTSEGTYRTGEYAYHITSGNDGRVYYLRRSQLVVDDPNRGSISGVVFSEGDGNGVYDRGDVLLTGYRVWVDLNRNGRFDSKDRVDYTGWDGSYMLSNLPPGTYALHLTEVRGWQASTPLQHTITVRADRTSRAHFGGLHRPVSIGGFVFNDTSGEGTVQPGEIGLRNVQVWLDDNDNGIADAAEPSTTTDRFGRYAFKNLAHGYRRVRIAMPAGYRATTPSLLSMPLQPGAKGGANFGVTQNILMRASVRMGASRFVGARLFVDLDRDGIFDQNEPSDITGSDGLAFIRSLSAGRYHVQVILPDGFQPAAGYAAARTMTLASGESGSFTFEVRRIT